MFHQHSDPSRRVFSRIAVWLSCTIGLVGAVAPAWARHGELPNRIPEPAPYNTQEADAHPPPYGRHFTGTGGPQSLTYAHNGSTPAGGGSDTIWLEDDFGDTVRVNITISAPVSAITVSPSALPTMTAGTPFSQTLTSSGGVGPYTYTLQTGALPVGLSLTSGGVISGTPQIAIRSGELKNCTCFGNHAIVCPIWAASNCTYSTPASFSATASSSPIGPAPMMATSVDFMRGV